MDPGTWRGIFTVVMLLLFIGIWIWAWSSVRRKVFDKAAQLPLERDDVVPDSPRIPDGEAKSKVEKNRHE